MNTQQMSFAQPSAAREATLNDNQRKVLATLRDQGPLTDFELGYAYRLQHGKMDQSWSGLRTRRRELEDMGLVYQHGTVRNENNRQVATFTAAG
jgi:hypothetical protein